MRTVEVKLASPYSVLIGDGVLAALGERVKSCSRANKVLVVTDSNVKSLYLDRVTALLKEANFEVYEFAFEAGENSKTARTYLDIIDCLGLHSFKRTDAVIALGGGVVGDVAGFAAATYMRGIDVVQVPTSLLAMIDSSVGGKTGVDLAYGKNLLGAFHQPKLVIADTALLKTLPDCEWKNGIGEGVKYACLDGGRIADIMSEGLREQNVEEFVALCVEYKAQIVANDEKESGLRKLLNFGHTVGHAIEKLSEYKIAHGTAVAEGVRVMADAALRHGEMSKCDYDKIIGILDLYKFGKAELSEEIFDAIANDKKAEGKNNISFVSINGIGNCRINTVELKEFKKYIIG